MNFILCLSHFCDSHGPTSIICTTITPPTCPTCYGTTSTESTPSSSNSSCRSVERETKAEDDDRRDATNLNTPSRLPSTPEPEPKTRPSSAHVSVSSRSSSTTPANKLRPSASSGDGGGSSSTIRPAVGSGSNAKPPSDATASATQEAAQHPPTLAHSASSTTPLSTPIDTPPASPANIVHSSSLPTNLPPHTVTHPPNAPTSTTQTPSCPNCALTLPAAITAKLPPSTSPTLRSKEYLWIKPPGGSAANSPSSLSSTPASSTDFPIPRSGHTHTLLYKSTHHPSTTHLHSVLRRSYIRALSCEVSPTPQQPTSIFFGDKKAGYTIAHIFQILDAKARGGKRTYAFLCVSDDEKKLLESWNFVTTSFKTLVTRIAQLASSSGTSVAVGPASGTVTPVSANRDITPGPGGSNKSAAGMSGMTTMGIGKSGGIEGFLRRGAMGAGTEARGLSDLVGKEEIFVEVHAGFVGILAGLGRRFGFEGGWSGETANAAGTAGVAGAGK
ncbi:hypothetical protein BJ508DRAFT_322493 [Ascobolus immersus RN42]|uniref:UDENN FLCN/SMCR8-type domain-containing protein n=1 Tax=Ascobolus immersus RN42 TaxID=1160509 RepID=A0A3N4IHW9_ASCIM|nr:hypothetical protein BJ508DRAFT_322493 [Ascobolus immersus RN42]